jgi:putative endonuclease
VGISQAVFPDNALSRFRDDGCFLVLSFRGSHRENPEFEPGLSIYLGMSKTGYVYIVANMKHGIMYTGVTSDLVKRTWQHRNGAFDGFSKKYGTKRLVYYQIFGDIPDAIAREKQLKKWRRQWKIELIETDNPCWDDLYFRITGF